MDMKSEVVVIKKLMEIAGICEKALEYTKEFSKFVADVNADLIEIVPQDIPTSLPRFSLLEVKEEVIKKENGEEEKRRIATVGVDCNSFAYLYLFYHVHLIKNKVARHLLSDISKVVKVDRRVVFTEPTGETKELIDKINSELDLKLPPDLIAFTYKSLYTYILHRQTQ